MVRAAGLENISKSEVKYFWHNQQLIRKAGSLPPDPRHLVKGIP
jgi:hypothetical protein